MSAAKTPFPFISSSRPAAEIDRTFDPPVIRLSMDVAYIPERIRELGQWVAALADEAERAEPDPEAVELARLLSEAAINAPFIHGDRSLDVAVWMLAIGYRRKGADDPGGAP